jgi:hypothetical protein
VKRPLEVRRMGVEERLMRDVTELREVVAL